MHRDKHLETSRILCLQTTEDPKEHIMIPLSLSCDPQAGAWEVPRRQILLRHERPE